MYNRYIVGDIVEIDKSLFIILATYLPLNSEPYYYLSSEDKQIGFTYTCSDLNKIVTKHIRKYQFNNELYCNKCDLKHLVDEDCSNDCVNSYQNVQDYYYIGDEVTLDVMYRHVATNSTIIAVYFNIYFYCGAHEASCFCLYFDYDNISGLLKPNIPENFLKYYPDVNLTPLFKDKFILPYLSFCYNGGKHAPQEVIREKIHLEKRRGFTINPNFNPCELCCGLLNCYSCKNKKYND